MTETIEQTYSVISRYRAERLYGGAEEGGWWYDWLTFDVVALAVNLADDQTVERAAQSLNEVERVEKLRRGGRDRYSVIGTPDTLYLPEVKAGEHQTTEREHYR